MSCPAQQPLRKCLGLRRLGLVDPRGRGREHPAPGWVQRRRPFGRRSWSMRGPRRVGPRPFHPEQPTPARAPGWIRVVIGGGGALARLGALRRADPVDPELREIIDRALERAIRAEEQGSETRYRRAMTQRVQRFDGDREGHRRRDATPPFGTLPGRPVQPEPRPGKLPVRRRIDHALNRSQGEVWIDTETYEIAQIQTGTGLVCTDISPRRKTVTAGTSTGSDRRRD